MVFSRRFRFVLFVWLAVWMSAREAGTGYGGLGGTKSGHFLAAGVRILCSETQDFQPQENCTIHTFLEHPPPALTRPRPRPRADFAIPLSLARTQTHIVSGKNSRLMIQKHHSYSDFKTGRKFCVCSVVVVSVRTCVRLSKLREELISVVFFIFSGLLLFWEFV